MTKLDPGALQVVSFEPLATLAPSTGADDSTEPFCDTDAAQVCTKFCGALA